MTEITALDDALSAHRRAPSPDPFWLGLVEAFGADDPSSAGAVGEDRAAS